MVTRAAPPTFCIVLSEHLTNHYAGPLVRGAAYAAAALGYALLIYTPLDINLGRRSLTLKDLPLLPRRVDGCLLPNMAGDDVVAYCRSAGAAALIYAGERPGVPSIGPDNRASARAAVAHLIGHGRRAIAHLLGLDGNQETRERFAGYREALADAGLPYDSALVAPGNFRLGDGQESIAGLLARGIAFDAIFAANDQSARGAMLALSHAGRRVPQDVAIVGFDDSVGSDTLVPPLTTVRQSAFQLGWEAVAALGRRAGGLPDVLAVPTQFVLRESCGCARAALDQAPNPTEQLAARLGVGQGPIVQPDAVERWLAPLDQALDQPDVWRQAFDAAIAGAAARGWHTPALREYLPVWRARHLRRGAAPAALDRLADHARDRLIQVQEKQHSRERLEREDRLNGLTYLVDVLRDCSQDQALEIALRHMIHSGARGALVALQTPAADSGLAVQYVDGAGAAQQWSGSSADFPPAAWLAPGDALIVMPLASRSQQHGLIGVVERAASSQLDLNDLFLRSVNTYRSTNLLNETLRELEIARTVQRSLLPRQAPAVADFDIAGASRTAHRVGGDFYGYYQRPDGSLALAVGDVAGKGMPAALLMSACVTALAGMINAGLAPGRTLSQMHQVVQPYMAQGQIAGVCLVYLKGAQVTLANAGAIAPLIWNRAGTRMLELGGLPLGTPLSGRRPYAEITLGLAAGDMLILSTDGIVEAADAHGELYGFERFTAAVAAGPATSAEAMLAHLFADVSEFVGEAETRDDMTIVVARYRA